MRLLFCSGRYPASWIVRIITRSPWSHVALVTTLAGVDVVLEAREGYGVRMAPLALYRTGYRGTVEQVEVAGVDEAAAVRWAVQRLGDPYDWDELLWIAIRMVCKTGTRLPEDAWICSEFVRDALAVGGLRMRTGPGDYVTPGDLYRDVER